MLKKKGMRGLIAITLIAVISLGFTIVKGYRPLLGLDLQGGVMVVLKPREAADPDKIATAIEKEIERPGRVKITVIREQRATAIAG